MLLSFNKAKVSRVQTMSAGLYRHCSARQASAVMDFFFFFFFLFCNNDENADRKCQSLSPSLTRAHAFKCDDTRVLPLCESQSNNSAAIYSLARVQLNSLEGVKHKTGTERRKKKKKKEIALNKVCAVI